MAGTPIQFASSKLKVQRAYRHIDEIITVLQEFLRTDFCRVVVDEHPERGYALKVESLAVLPPDIALAIGDTVHCLRVAMDYIITTTLPQFEHWISFPMGEKREDVIATRSHRAIKEALPDVADFITDKIQPYKGGDFKIWEICTLDNSDKHRLLIPAISIQRITGIDAIDRNQNRVINMTVTVQEGRFAIPFSTDAPLKITNYGKAVADIFFPKGSLFDRKAVIPTLTECADLSLKVIEALESLSFGQVTKPNS